MGAKGGGSLTRSQVCALKKHSTTIVVHPSPMVQPCLAPLQRKRLQRRARFNRVFDPARSSLVSPAEAARKAAQRKRDMGSFATVGTLQDALQSALKEAPVPTGSIKSIALPHAL